MPMRGTTLTGVRRFLFEGNDESGTEQRTAEAMSLLWTMSEVAEENANDLHQRAGLT